MIRSLGACVLLLVLPSCVAALGNTTYGAGITQSSLPDLRDRQAAADRVVAICERKLALLRAQSEAGRTSELDIADAEIAVEKARIQAIEFRTQLRSVESAKDED